MPAQKTSLGRRFRPLRHVSILHGWRFRWVFLVWLSARLVGAVEIQPPGTIPAERWLRVATPDEDINQGVRRADKQPVLEYTTTIFANGSVILFGLTSAEQTKAILDFMSRQAFVVPGPYHIPPVRAEDLPQNPPGVYCNGGCGWGRGIMPSVTLACLAHGRLDQGKIESNPSNSPRIETEGGLRRIRAEIKGGGRLTLRPTMP